MFKNGFLCYFVLLLITVVTIKTKKSWWQHQCLWITRYASNKHYVTTSSVNMSLYRYFLKLKQIVLTRFFRKLRGTTGLCVCLLTVFWLLCFLYVCFIRYVEKNNEPLAVHNPFIYIEPLNGFFRRTRNRNGEKVDWHDYKMIAEEEQREGPGEHGEAVTLLTNETEINKKIFDENGYNAYISDKISVNRSVTKCRHPECVFDNLFKINFLNFHFQLPNETLSKGAAQRFHNHPCVWWTPKHSSQNGSQLYKPITSGDSKGNHYGKR